MGLLERFTSIFKAKAHNIAEKFEDPEELLNYSFEKQQELINKLRRDITEVVTSKKRLEMQRAKLAANIATLEDQARRSLKSNREDLAKMALERKNIITIQINNLDKQIEGIQRDQEKLEDAERRLTTKIDEFKTRKEMIKAEYSAAEAQVKIKENLSGISEEMGDIGMILNRVEEKTDRMKAKAEALDEMMESGVLTDYTQSYEPNDTDIEKELKKVSLDSAVEEELAKLKAETNNP
ncbi:MAG TPA: PspA/IM30 family protein [Nitrososphaeraceae archaeon]|jgi:phage shock protein A|nr:PspA/IM30 family protein [Nitrososphaeraceae archaeon]